MPIRIQKDLPAREILENENIFIMDEDRAMHQDIRPLKIALLNLMPKKEETELQILRCLSNSPLQVDVTFVMVSSHESKNTSLSHLNRFYEHFDDIKDQYFDGMIITGAPIEFYEFEEVDFWDELTVIFDWCEKHVTSTMFQCWGAQAAVYYYYGINKVILPEKLSGLFWHKAIHKSIPLIRGFDDYFLAPHSRNSEIPLQAMRDCDKITVLCESEEAGFLLGMADEGRKVFIQGHPEYDRITLLGEYERDKAKGLNIVPENYFPDNDVTKRPPLMWRAHSTNLYMNWLNYYVYQITPYNLYGAPTLGK